VELSDDVRAAVIAHAIRSGNAPAVGTVVGLRVRIKGGQRVPAEFTVAEQDIVNARKLINDQRQQFHKGTTRVESNQ
jgi:hypothetical protein